MTIHCAATYFDEITGKPGFILGSDRLASVRNLSDKSIKKDKKQFYTDKTFDSKCTIGFVRGVIPLRNDTPDAFRQALAELEGIFDDIKEHTNYSHVPLLQRTSEYVLMIGKRTSSTLELFTVSNTRPNNNNVAKSLYKIKGDSLPKAESWGWVAINSTHYQTFRMKPILSKNKARDVVVQLTSAQQLALTPQTQPTLYQMTYGGIERVVLSPQPQQNL